MYKFNFNNIGFGAVCSFRHPWEILKHISHGWGHFRAFYTCECFSQQGRCLKTPHRQSRTSAPAQNARTLTSSDGAEMLCCLWALGFQINFETVRITERWPWGFHALSLHATLSTPNRHHALVSPVLERTCICLCITHSLLLSPSPSPLYPLPFPLHQGETQDSPISTPELIPLATFSLYDRPLITCSSTQALPLNFPPVPSQELKVSSKNPALWERQFPLWLQKVCSKTPIRCLKPCIVSNLKFLYFSLTYLW